MNDDERRELSKTLRGAAPDVLAEIMREAESFLGEQLKSGLAADLRAMTMAVILAAILAALVGGTASLVAAGIKVGWHVIAVLPLAACLSFALMFAVMAARPTSFSYTGTNPTKWIPDIKDGRSLHDSKAGQVAIYAQGIIQNKTCLDEGHRWLKLALRTATAGILISTLVEFIVVCSLAAKNGFSI
jgi:hypothetical protein